MSSTPIGPATSESPGVSVEHFYAALADIGDLVAAMPRPQALYAGVMDIFERHLGAMRVLVGEIDHEAGVLRRRAPDPVPEGQEDIYPELVSLAIARPRFWEGKIEVEPNIVEAPGREALRPAYARHGIRASAAVPVRCFGKVHAALILRARDPAFFAPELLQLLERVALSVGHALEGDVQRTRLDRSLLAAERSQLALRILSETLKVATHAGNEEELFNQACRVVVETGGYPVCWMGLLEQGGSTQTLKARAHAGRGAETYQALEIQLADLDISTSVSAAVIKSGEARVKLPREGGAQGWAVHARQLELRALLGLPLRLRGQIGGVIVIGASSEDAFSGAELRIFDEMAQELSLGLERLRAGKAQFLAEQELKLSLRRFQAILASRYAGILVLDNERVQFCNATFCRLFELAETPDQLVGMSSTMLHERILEVFANPDQELERIRSILLDAAPVELEEVALDRGRTYLRSFAPITFDDRPHGRVWQYIDITERKAQEAEVERLAYYDPLTALPNRRLFLELLEQGRGQARRHQVRLAVGVLDLDDFKHINDQFGHAAGDEVLGRVARRIAAVLRDGDVVARLGGDKFALLLTHANSEHDARLTSASILETLRYPMPWEDKVLHLSASLGWTFYPQDAADAETLLGHADLAMYDAKDQGRDREQVYSSAMALVNIEQRSMKARVAAALEDGRMTLRFHPIVALDTASGDWRVVGAEALLRMHDAALGLLSPALFHHALDDAKLARPIGRYVLDRALRASAAWLNKGVRLSVAVNISTRHLMQQEFIADIDEALAAHPEVDATLLCIEITETGPLVDPTGARQVIDECRARGINVSLDDFGTGNASLSHVQQMDVGTLKIDQSFVRDILVEPRNIAIAAGILTTARLLKIAVIAEGVETEEQGVLLISLGCGQLQGHVIAEPMLATAIPAWVENWVYPASWRLAAPVVLERRQPNIN
ncbi:EAL domain-containing protein [Rhodanobacter ginsengisoli]|uniref:EAL domain-containing protein n=1 Tax=Rhodanobacter ginsengisoli TaxID=418646 RepID=A0ABW0QMP4_9GAMM